MKISLFSKPYINKVYSFLLMITLMSGTPLFASANWISDFFTGEQVQASDEVVDIDNTGTDSNLQNMDLFNSESSVNPDRKNIDEQKDKVIVQEDSFIYSDGLFGSDVSFEKSPLSDQINVYTVKEGDTISEIAELFNISINTIRWENNISGQNISVGQKLNILPVTGVKYIIKSGDTISKIADIHEAETEDIYIFNDITKDSVLKKGDVIFVPNGIIKPVVVKKTPSTTPSKVSPSNTKIQSGYYMRPVVGITTSPYGSRRGGFHAGVDIGNKRGTPVVAAASGLVVKVVSGCVEGRTSCGGRYGNYIEIEHSNGTKTIYAHLSKVSVRVGQTVSAGSHIGSLGNTGRSTGPHLHFEIENSNGSKMRPSF